MSATRKDGLIGPFGPPTGSSSLSAVSMGYTISKDSTEGNIATQDRLLGDWDRKNGSGTPCRKDNEKSDAATTLTRPERLERSSPAESTTPQSIQRPKHRKLRGLNSKGGQPQSLRMIAPIQKPVNEDLSRSPPASPNGSNWATPPPSTWSRIKRAESTRSGSFSGEGGSQSAESGSHSVQSGHYWAAAGSDWTDAGSYSAEAVATRKLWANQRIVKDVALERYLSDRDDNLYDRLHLPEGTLVKKVNK